jgi:hypothetical protein
MKIKKAGLDNLESIPNVGTAIASKLRLLGYEKPSELTGANPYAMFKKLSEITGRRNDPCLLDVFISAVSFCDGKAPKPWWKFTAERKAKLMKIQTNKKTCKKKQQTIRNK